jgi:hypothetical protein
MFVDFYSKSMHPCIHPIHSSAMQQIISLVGVHIFAFIQGSKNAVYSMLSKSRGELIIVIVIESCSSLDPIKM